MQDKDYYNHMLENLLFELKKMDSIMESKTIIQYETISIKEWVKIEPFIEPLKFDGNGKPSMAMDFYTKTIYPVLKSGEEKKFGFKKLFAIRIDDYDFRQMLSKCENIIHL